MSQCICIYKVVCPVCLWAASERQHWLEKLDSKSGRDFLHQVATALIHTGIERSPKHHLGSCLIFIILLVQTE